MLNNFRQRLSVDQIGGRFAVVRREQWVQADGTHRLNVIMADGPFDDRAGAERAKDLIEARAAL